MFSDIGLKPTAKPMRLSDVYRGEADPIEGSLTFVEVGNDHGMSISEAMALGQTLWEFGCDHTADLVIPSIRSIRQVE